MRKSVIAGVIAGSMLAGGGIGIALFGPNVAGAQSGTTTTTAPAAAAPSATPHSNEDTTHEKAESAQREADEDAGRVGRGGPSHGGGPNEDAAHEASETPEHEAQENARTGSTTPTTQPGA